MDIDVRKQAQVNVVRCRGAFRLGPAVDDFRAHMEAMLREPAPQIVVNLSEVNSLDSSGIGALVRTQTAAKQHGGAVKLVNPTKFVLQTLKMVGLLTVFELHLDEAEAVRSFDSGIQVASGS